MTGDTAAGYTEVYVRQVPDLLCICWRCSVAAGLPQNTPVPQQ
jgi:hypothetical protein